VRAIDADALQLAIVEEGQANKRKKYSIGDIWELTGAEIREVINSMPTIQLEPHWIPVTERLPYAECGESDNVLATCGCRDVEDGSIRWIKTLYFNGGNWCYPTGETYLEKVYAWMPLPEPYKGVTE
jgi:hypothetical protein